MRAAQAFPYGAIFFSDYSGRSQKCTLRHQRVAIGCHPVCAQSGCLPHCIDFSDPAEIKQTVLDKSKNGRRLERDLPEGYHIFKKNLTLLRTIAQ
jgi:Fe-S-cluster-containing dehydrogenase component